MGSVGDTGFLVAYLSRRDSHHRWARALKVELPVRTCEAVLAEVAHLTNASEELVRMILKGDVWVDFELRRHASDILRWLEKYADLDPGLTDACVVKLGELYPNDPILTTDRSDFTAYRTLGGKPLNCIFPPV